jgi:hypothetical protein
VPGSGDYTRRFALELSPLPFFFAIEDKDMKLAELVIQLSANTASLKKDFEQARAQAAEFASSMKSALAGIGVGIGVGGIAEAIKSVVEYEDKIGLAAKATGMTAEQMSSLSYAAKQFEVPLHDLTMGLAYFDRVEGGLMRSKQGQTALHLLGLSVRDLNGHLKDSHTMLMEVADKFSKLQDSTAKTAAATALFGQTYGLELIPFLDQGSRGIAALEAKAKQLGVTLNENDVQGAVKAEAALHNLESGVMGLGVAASRTLVPALTFLGEVATGDSYALKALTDRVKELGLEWLKTELYITPLHFFTGGLRNKIQREINDLATNESVARSGMMNDLPDFASLFKQNNLEIPVNALGHGARAVHQVADAIRSLKDQLLGLEEGPAAKAIQHLKEIGASPAQLGEAKAILGQIAAIKQQRQAQEQLTEANRAYDRMVDDLSDSILHLDTAQKDYIKTVAQLNMLEAKGVDITQGLTLAREKYQQTLLAQIKTPAQAGYGKQAAGGYQGGVLDQILTGNSGIPPETRMMQLGSLAQQLGHKMQNSFTNMIVSGESFSSVLQNLTTMFAEFILKAEVFSTLGQFFGGSNGSGIGGLIGSFFTGLAGGRASGGPVTAGQLYMVGESGPELFAPGMSGSIIPNGSQIGGRGTTVNVDARGADAGVENKIYRAMQAAQKATLGQSLVMNYEYQARGGTL